MTMRSKYLALACAGALGLSACQTTEGQGQVFGALAGAAAAYALTDGSDDETRLLAALAGAAAGAYLGGEIAKRLNQSERVQATQATQAALEAPVVAAPQTPATPAPTSPGAVPVQSKQVAWQSDSRTDVAGSAQVTQVAQNPSTGGECRTVREVAIIRGEEIIQDTQYCKGNTGQWSAVV